MTVAHMRVKAGQRPECSWRYPVVVADFVIDANHRLSLAELPCWRAPRQCGRWIAEPCYHAAGVSPRATSSTRNRPPRRDNT